MNSSQEKLFEIKTLPELAQVADYIINKFTYCQTYLLNGDLGAGKTTLIQFILQKLNYAHKVNSPTFGKIHEYKTDCFLIYHFDLYRALPNIGEFEEILLQKNSLLFIEWASELPQEYLELLQNNFLEIQINCFEEKRIIKIK